jgi:hypothetical protein
MGAGWTLWERQRQDPWLRLLGAARARLQKAGFALSPTCTPRDMAKQLSQHHPALLDWLLRLEAQRYAPATTHSVRLGTLKREFNQLIWPK